MFAYHRALDAMETQRKIFVTGATGFVGRALLARLTGLSVVGLTHGGAELQGANVRFVRGDLAQADAWTRELVGVDMVVHCAALTGKARERDLVRVNVDGTRALVDACSAAGVRRFLHVSSIAVSYPELAHYPYARSKRDAEQVVRESGLEWTIARPTIVLGRGSRIAKTLRGMAGLPLVPIFGAGRVRIQPIDVADLALLLRDWVDDTSLARDTFDLGGREACEFRDLLSRAHTRLRGGRARFVRLPCKAAIAVLGPLEKGLLPLLPVTAGQLYAFAYDSAVTPNRWWERRRAELKGVDELVEDLARDA